ncbi:hypothetical protein EZJ58_3307 [Sodalis ligni]|uniref:Uncharacterized protein n=1 Tax=Sodalis ligni TaxID=2697027 RepID=A0A4R1NE31_9GAMM|nr:hypothetical protein EZJ58_3307 [Sodalis ligni]
MDNLKLLILIILSAIKNPRGEMREVKILLYLHITYPFYFIYLLH